MYSSDDLKTWDKQYIWHPFTQMSDWMEGDPLIIERGEGFHLIDTEGRRYIDGVSSLWVIVHGHGRKELTDAIERQAKELCHSTLLGLANVPAVVLAKKLTGILPGNLTKVFYSDNGSTSVEIAVKMSYQYWQQMGQKKKKKFISFKNAYHGDTIGSVSIGGIDLFHKVYRPLLFSSFKAPSPYCYRCSLKLTKDACGMACIGQFEEMVKKHRDEVCAVIIEPLVQGAAGMLTQPDGFLNRIWKIARENGLHFITDEVATGFGRTGKMFACEHENIEPDFICLAKGITGGYLPLAATVTTDEIFRGFLGRFDECKTFFHGHTYTGNPVAAAVAVENLALFERERTIEKMGHKVTLLRNELKHFEDLPQVGEIRQRGFMVGIELVKNQKTKKPYPASAKIGQKVTLAARRRGVIIRPLGDVIVLMPPPAIDEATLKELAGITYDSIQEATGQP